MQKTIAALLAVAYLGLHNYCFAYAMVCGEAHHVPSLSSSLAQHADQHHSHFEDHGPQKTDHHGDSQQSHSHDHSDSEGTDPCCINSQQASALISPQPVLAANFFSLGIAFAAVPPNGTCVAKEAGCSLNKHGPPRLVYQDAVLFPRSSRAPPRLPSL